MNIPTRLRLRHVAIAAVLATAAVVGCSSEPTGVPIEQTTFADTLHINLAQFTKLPSGMYIREDSTGSGATATAGNTVSVRYAGYLANGTLFDANTAPGKPVFSFQLGTGSVINGFDIGIQGMKVGGRRTLIIPPELAYGANGNGTIPPYSVLVFTVSLVSIP